MNPHISLLMLLCLGASALFAGCTAPHDPQPTPTTTITTVPTTQIPAVESPVLTIDPRLDEMKITFDAVEREDGQGVILKLHVDPKGAAIARDGADILTTFFAYNTAARSGDPVPVSADEVRAAGVPYRSVFITVYDAPVEITADLPRESAIKRLDISRDYVYGAVIWIRD
ncbi:hypothetical protein J2129_001901 [Methanofollis sp. W23]|uniref:hypothetical protein n=1 Tax=Methanofollis sp. W23 TaxID=2817849 RepID=UPI001AEA06E8|nr:hypothetical protein [Methanofollis sp. W23]MBP2146447.1 hypothetical protein [Methanofollis sp. W23]